MSILDLIEERFKAGARSVEVTSWEWARYPGVIAGFTHLPKHDQLAQWAKWKGYDYMFDIARNVHLLYKFYEPTK